MKLTKQISAFLISTVILAGCATSSDNEVKPARLTAVNSEFSVATLWTIAPSNGSGYHNLKLNPTYANGQIIVTGHEGIVAAIQPQNGRTVWRVNTQAPVSSG